MRCKHPYIENKISEETTGIRRSPELIYTVPILPSTILKYTKVNGCTPMYKCAPITFTPKYMVSKLTDQDDIRQRHFMFSNMAVSLMELQVQ